MGASRRFAAGPGCPLQSFTLRVKVFPLPSLAQAKKKQPQVVY
jgi:hypothetical protein